MKRILTIVLLLFAGATAGRVVVAEMAGAGRGKGDAAAVRVPDRGKVLAAYYFLVGKVRCSTCRRMEAYSRAAVKERLPGEAAAGKVLFGVVDTEKPRFRHFKKDFALPSTSLVLALYVDGKLRRFKNLNRIWRLVRDRKAFLDYVEREARALLEEGK